MVSLFGKGKTLRCPDCDEAFKAPRMDEKLLGAGWAMPGTGRVTCPKCGAKHPRKDYEEVQGPGDSSAAKA